jgi:hypothetical protein
VSGGSVDSAWFWKKLILIPLRVRGDRTALRHRTRRADRRLRSAAACEQHGGGGAYSEAPQVSTPMVSGILQAP